MINSTLIFRIIFLFILGGLFGWLLEYILFNKRACDRTLTTIFEECYPFLMIYGTGLVILYLIYKYLPGDMNFITKVIIGTILVVIFECLIGTITGKIFGGRTWAYSGLTMCNKYISLKVAFGWMFATATVMVLFNVLGW